MNKTYMNNFLFLKAPFKFFLRCSTRQCNIDEIESNSHTEIFASVYILLLGRIIILMKLIDFVQSLCQTLKVLMKPKKVQI